MAGGTSNLNSSEAQFSQFADALSQSKGQDVSSLLDTNNGLAILFADVCGERAMRLAEEAGTGGVGTMLSRRLQNANESVSGFLQTYVEEDDAEDALAWRLEEQTWRLLHQLHAERTQRKTETEETFADASSSKGNPYRTPFSAVQDIIDADAALAELSIVREWLSTNLLCTHPVEVRKGYWPFTKNKLRSERRTAVGGTSKATSSATRSYSAFGGTGSRSGGGAGKGVRSLDPDATARELSTLELEDAAYEKALNKTLFEYTRGGQLDNAIDLARQTDRSWRAASLRGANLYWRPGMDEDIGDELSAPIGNRNRSLWKAVCRSLCVKSSLDEFEGALYGALSGDLKSVLAVSTSWDAQLWAYTNARVEATIDARLNASGTWWSQEAPESFGLASGANEAGAVQLIELATPEKFKASDVGRAPKNDVDAASAAERAEEAPLATELRSVFVRLSQTEQHGIHVQANHPFRIVQRAIILSELPALLTHVESLLPSMRVTVSTSQYVRLVRFFAHLILFLRLTKWETMPNDVVCNAILKSYVDVLESMGGGEDELVALYASSLEPESATESYAHYLKLMDAHERIDVKQSALLRAQTHDLDIAAVAITTVSMVFDELFPTFMPTFSIPKTPLTQLSTSITPAEDRLIRAIDWLCIHQSTYVDAIIHVNILIRLFLNNGRMNAAQKALFEIPPNVLEKVGEMEAEGDKDFQAIELVHWRCFFDAIDRHLRFVEVWSRRPAEKASRVDQLNWAKGLQGVVDDAKTAVVQVFQMDWIKFSLGHRAAADVHTERRLVELARIRQIYIPELVSRFHSMLYECRDILPDTLVDAVQLPNLVADERHKLYLDFISGEENRLGDFLQRVRMVELASLKRNPDPFYLSRSSTSIL